MTMRRAKCEWDPRYDRCEHVAGDGVVDLVTYELTDRPGAAHSRPAWRAVRAAFPVLCFVLGLAAGLAAAAAI